MLTFRIHQNVTLPVCLALLICLHDRDSLRYLTFQPLLKCCDTSKVEAVRVPDVVMMIDVKMFSHSILCVLSLNSIPVLSKAVDCIVPGLSLVLSQDVGLSTHLAGRTIKVTLY